MKLYLDADFRCHLSGGAGMTEMDTELFDGKRMRTKDREFMTSVVAMVESRIA